MDTIPVLESIAKTLPGLPPEAVESILVTFDALVGVSDAAHRPAAARLLRDAARLCDETRKPRLLAAASAVEVGEPCALTPDGLSWKQAAAAQTVTVDQFQAEHWQDPPPAPPSENAGADLEDEPEEEPEEEPEFMRWEPPELPRLRLRHFFPGLVVRVRREIQDIRGRVAIAGQVLHVLTCESSEADGGRTTLSLLDGTLRLDAGTPHYPAILGNGANGWFQPVPSAACLEDLCEAIDRRLTGLVDAASGDDDEDDDDEDEGDPNTQMAAAIREDLERCRDWLSGSAKRGPRPRCDSGPLAAQLFGRNHELAAWVPLLFAAMEFCIPDASDQSQGR